jgi:hypothetical protein
MKGVMKKKIDIIYDKREDILLKEINQYLNST